MDFQNFNSTVTVDSILGSGTRLSEFEIVDLIGRGGFGVVYLAQDRALARRVAVKEYMPASLAVRAPDASVHVSSAQHEAVFQVGLRSFVNEARLLAQFDHPALLKVYRFWEANGTAYMAMPYYEGLTLKDWLRQQPAPPDEAWLRRLLMPVLDALELLHRENCFHRDIAPDNIMLLADGRPVLLDFGAARRVIGDMTQALTVILKPGYAPVEQYAETPGIRQGPWTDIYALGALVYFTITGHTPPPSVGRMIDDRYQPLADIAAGRYSDAFLRAIDRCLALRSEHRPQSIADLRQLLTCPTAGPSDATVLIAPSVGWVAKQDVESQAAAQSVQAGSGRVPPYKRAIVPLIAVALLVSVALAALQPDTATRSSLSPSAESATIEPQRQAPDPMSATSPSALAVGEEVLDPDRSSGATEEPAAQRPAADGFRRDKPAARAMRRAASHASDSPGDNGHQPPESPQTADEVFKQRKEAECRSGLLGLLCREDIRRKVCQNRWSDDPGPGASICKLQRVD